MKIMLAEQQKKTLEWKKNKRAEKKSDFQGRLFVSMIAHFVLSFYRA